MNEPARVTVCPSPEELASAAADELCASAARAIAQRGICYIALSGGETPRMIYAILAGQGFSSRVDWEHVHLFFGDERMVPPGDAASNYGMAQRELIQYLPIPAGNVHRIQGETPAPDAAHEYEMELDRVFNAGMPRFDVIMLGLGEDGHTASIFPGTTAVVERVRKVLGCFVPQLGSWRVTLTLPVILNAREIMFVVAGKRKARIVGTLLPAGVLSPDLPASLVRPLQGSVHWLLDKEAASLLSDPHR
jgi:6-phosphogluconolactonase